MDPNAPCRNIATAGTIKSESYPLEVHKLFEDIKVSGEACPMWVPLVENNEANGEGADFFIRKYIDNLLAKDRQIDTLVLGCTITRYYCPRYKNSFPKGVKVVAQGEYVATSLKDYLHRHPEMDMKCTREGKCRFYTTEAEDKFIESASMFLNENITVQRITLE